MQCVEYVLNSRRGAVRAASVAGLRVVDGVDDDGAAAGDGAGRQTHLRQAALRQRQGGAQEPQGEVSDEYALSISIRGVS